MEEKLCNEKMNNHEKRISKSEQKIDGLEKIYISIEKMILEIKALREDTNNLSDRLKEIESKPARKWEQISSYVLTAIIGAILTFLFVKIGLK